MKEHKAGGKAKHTANELVTGFPTNEFSLSQGIFGDLYFLSHKGGLDEWGGLIAGGFLEQHFQQTSEIYALLDSQDRKTEFLDTIKKYREEGLGVIAHCPFVKSHEAEPEKQKFLDFDFEWIAIPEEYRDKPVKKFPLPENGNPRIVQMNGLEVKISDLKRTIDLVSEAGIEYLTTHVTAPGIFLKGKSWQEYVSRICELAEYIQKENKNVKLAIETGGIMQFNELFSQVKERTGYEVCFNLDTAHLLLDLMHIEKNKLMNRSKPANEEKNDVEEIKKIVEGRLPKLNKKVIDFYKRNKDKIKVIHLTQTAPWVDMHEGIEDGLGILSCNEEIIRLANENYRKKGDKKYLMIESEPSRKGILHFIKAKHGEVTGKRAIGNNETLFMLMGLPASGKSNALEILQAAEFEIITEKMGIIRTDDLRRKYLEEAYSVSEWVGRESRQLVYDEGFRREHLALELKQGAVYDATFDQRENRERAVEIAKSCDVKDVYILHFECSTEEAKKRITDRNQRIAELEKKEMIVAGSLTMKDPEKYDRFKAEYEKINFAGEFESENGMKVHAIAVDTTAGINTIKILNPDQKTWAIVDALKRAYKQQYNAEYRIEKMSL